MFGLSLPHLIIVTFVLLLFGSRRLPELGEALGKGLRSFKRGLEGKGQKELEHDEKP
jgi:sec-independent protein translocase protein TatA